MIRYGRIEFPSWARLVLPLFTLLLLAESTSGDEEQVEDSSASQGSIVDRDLSSELSALERFSDPRIRTIGLRVLMANADEESLVSFLNQANQLRPEELREELFSVVLSELALINPDLALYQVRNFSNIAIESVVAPIFEVWSIKNLDQAVETAKQLTGKWHDYAVDAILETRSDLSSSDRKDIATRMMGRSLANTILGIMDSTAPVEDPESAWKEFLTENQHRISRLNINETIRLRRICEALVKEIGLEAVLDRIETSIPDHRTKSRTVASVLESVAGHDAEKALEQAIYFQNRIEPTVLATISLQLATTDPRAALNALNSVRSSGNRLQLQRNVVKAWSNIDPYEILDSLHSLPRSMHTYSREQAMIAIAEDSIDNAVLLLPEVENYESKVRIAVKIIDHWAKTDVAGAVDWLSTDSEVSGLSDELLPTVIESLATDNSQLAMQIAQQEQIGESEIGHEVLVVRSVAQRDLNASIELLGNVRNETTRIAALGEIGQVLISSGEAQEAIQLGNEQLAAEPERAKYISSIASALLVDAPGVLAENLGALPTASERSRMAVMLLMRPQFGDELSEDQLEKVRAYAPEGFTPSSLPNVRDMLR